jgi:hypothetical protein
MGTSTGRRVFAPIAPDVERVGKAVLNAAFKVHTALGPGLLESVYETCTAFELAQSGLCAPTQVALPVTYQGIKMDAGLRPDMIVEESLDADGGLPGVNHLSLIEALDHFFFNVLVGQVKQEITDQHE